MNADIDGELAEAERALVAGDLAAAIQHFREAGDLAVQYQLWRSAIRSYRSALELDVVDRVSVRKVVALGNKVHSLRDWVAYDEALATHPTWLHFSCRNAQIVIGDRGAHVDCAPIGRVIGIAMTAADRIDAQPDERFVDMPLAMALILRRAMWPTEPDAPVRLQIGFGGHSRVWLGVVGGWESV